MFRKHSLLLAALALALAAPVAHGASAKTFVVNVHGGASLPLGDFKDENQLNAKTGYLFGGGFDYMLTEMFAIGLDGSYGKNKGGDEGTVFDLGGGDELFVDEDKMTIRQLGAHAKWLFPTQSPLSPYALISLGAYNVKDKLTWTETIGGTSTTYEAQYGYGTRIGGKIGLGATYKATETVGIGIEGDFNFISEDDAQNVTGSSSLRYASVRAGVSFNTLPK